MKIILPTILLILMSSSAFSTHLMGGEITAKQIGPLEYEINMVLYRDAFGIDMDQTQQYSIFNQAGQNIGVYDFNFRSSVSGDQVSGFPYGVEPYYFRDVITLPYGGVYRIAWVDCCRNEAILNLTYPLNDNMYLSTTLTAYHSYHNSTPEFLSPPVVYLPVLTHWQYNPLPVDTDGDSLAWVIDNVYRNYDGEYATNTSYPCGGWELPYSAPADTFSIDHQTGIISWMASTLGNFVASVLVTEFRDGQEIGRVRRDMQFVVVPSGGDEPPALAINGEQLNMHGNPQFNMVPGQTLKIQVTGSDRENSNDLEIYAYSELFADTNFAASFTTSENGNNQDGVFTLKADDLFVGESSLVNFRVTDGLWNYDVTVVIKMFETFVPVIDEQTGFLVYPNPSEGQFNIWLENPIQGAVQLEVRDMHGKIVGAKDELQVFGGENHWQMDFDLLPGLYLVYLTDKCGMVSSQKLVVR